MTLDIPYEIGEYKKHRENPNHETVCKDSWVCDYLSKYVAEVERLKAENETLNTKVAMEQRTVSRFERRTTERWDENDKLREALERHRPPTCREHDACKSMYDNEALKGGE